MNLLHYQDLRSKRIVRTWTTLNKWIDERGFPPGRIIGKYRTWTEAEILDWIEGQPTVKQALRGNALKRRRNASDKEADAA